MRPRVGRLVVVGGHSRGVGKTMLVERLLRAWSGERVAALKISAHRHAADGRAIAIERAFEPGGRTQAGRYLAAGAGSAWLCRCPEPRMPEAAWFVEALRTRGWDVIVESNRIVHEVRPDLVMFVASAGTGDWKASSGPCLRRADALVLSPHTDVVPVMAWRLGWVPGDGRAVLAFDRTWTIAGLDDWVRSRLAPRGRRDARERRRPPPGEVSGPPPPRARHDRRSGIRRWPCESRGPSPSGS